jgi:DNA invertase Pin-like site-specific DNA recombinase
LFFGEIEFHFSSPLPGPEGGVLPDQIIRCAIYGRVSTSEQIKGHSIETQLERCRQHAATHGWQVEAEYVDPGYSGTNDERPAFQEMIQAALAGVFQIIIVYSFDRLFRNMEHAVVYKSLLRKDGVQVYSVLEPIDDSPMSFIQEGIIDLFAAYYSINLSTKIKGGLRKAVKGGQWPWKAPLGYERVDNWVEVSEMGAFIQQAFQEFSTGQYTLDQWAERAYRLGIRSLSGNKLTGKDWSRIFHNRFYMGILEYSGVSAEGRHTPLVSEETFEKVQQVLLAKSSNKGIRSYRFYLLRGLVWSDDSQSRMTGAVGKGYKYYRSKKNTSGGKRHHVQAELLERQVAAALSAVVVDPAAIDNSLKLDEAMLLALRVAPNVGILYRQLRTDEQRRALLVLVVDQYGFKVSGDNIVSVDVRAPFCLSIQFDQPPGGSIDSSGVQHSRTSSLDIVTPLFFLGVDQ